MIRALCVAGLVAGALGNISGRTPPPPPPVDEPWQVKELIDSERLQHHMFTSELFKKARELYAIAETSIPEYGHPTRAIGSIGHTKTVEWIVSTLKSLGNYYSIQLQSFPATSGRIITDELKIGGIEPNTSAALTLSPSTPNKQPVTGNLILVSNLGCNDTDFPSAVAGQIAFVSRGICTFSQKSENAGKAGALAVVIFNNVPGALGGTLGQPAPAQVASMGISQEESVPYVAALKAGETISATVTIDSIVRAFNTTNVIAQTNHGDQENCVFAGGHSDSVEPGPGINDDGSGTISLLELAIQLTKFKVNNCVRLGWWSAEEVGLVGSEYYVSNLTPAENKKIRMFLDYDMIASPNFAYQVYNSSDVDNPNGSGHIRQLYTDWYDARGIPYKFIPFDGRSDYDAFINNGIPGSGIATGAEGVKTEAEVALFGGVAGDWYDPCYHKLCDDLNNLNETAWHINTKLIFHSVATYARSLEGFPERVASNATGVTKRWQSPSGPAIKHSHADHHGCGRQPDY